MPFRVAFILFLAAFGLCSGSWASITCGILIKVAAGQPGHEPMIAADLHSHFVVVASAVNRVPVRIFDLPTEDIPQTLFDETQQKYEIATPDGVHVTGIALSRFNPEVTQSIAVSYSDGNVSVYKASDGSKMYSLAQHRAAPTKIRFSPDAKLLLVVTPTKAHLWQGAKAVRTLDAGKKDAEAMHVGIAAGSFAFDNSKLVTFAEDGTGMRWKLDDIAQSPEYTTARGVRLEGNTWPVLTGSIHINPLRCLAGTANGSLMLWEGVARDQKGIAMRNRTNASINHVDVSRDGNFAVAGYADGIARVWDLRSKQVVGKIKMPYTGPIVRVYFSYLSRRVITAHGDGGIRIWNRYGLKEGDVTLPLHYEFAVAPSAITDMQLLRDGKIITGHADGSVRFGSLPRH